MSRIDENVAKFGWHATAIPLSAESPGFVYTTGVLASFNHAEAIIFGLDALVCHRALSAMIEAIRKGSVFVDGVHDGLLTRKIAVRAVHPTQHLVYFADALGYHRRRKVSANFTAIQLFWSDGTGRFPFEVGCDPRVGNVQPRLDVPLTTEELEDFITRIGEG